MYTPPAPRENPPDSTLRFAVGDPTGLRSSTWTVIGQQAGDVYIGARTNMRNTKVSLHRTGKWRLAYTAQSGETATPEGDRVLYRYDPPPECAPGWRHGATVVVPTSTLRLPFPEKPTKDRNPISWWPAPDKGWGLRFDVLLGSDGCDQGLTVNGAAGQVGRLALADGSVVWVVATAVPTSAQNEELYRSIREQARERATGDMEAPTAMAWGFDTDSGHPVLIDLGDPTNDDPAGPDAGR